MCEVEVWLHSALTVALDGAEWSTSGPNYLASGKQTLGTHLIGGWVRARAGLDIGEQKLI